MPIEMTLPGLLLWHELSDVYPTGAGLKAIGREGIALAGTAVVTICPGEPMNWKTLEVRVNE